MLDTMSQFRNAILSTGLQPPEIIIAGKLHRFPGAGKNNGNSAGWCKLFDDMQSGCFGDWSTGLSERWLASRGQPFSPTERTAYKRNIKATREQAKKKLRQKQIAAAKRASTIWFTARPAPADHPYLIRKVINSNNARLHKDALLLPIKNFNGKITSLQFIKPNGGKLLLSGGRKKACFIRVAGNMENIAQVIICEGWATGGTLADENPTALVLAAIDAGNLKSVAVAARRRWPSAELVIAGDDDRLVKENPGATKARAAAIAAGAQLILPQWPIGCSESLTDFNDLAAWTKGLIS